jgi:hypothetical protein
MGLLGRFLDDEALGDPAVGQPAGDQLEHLALARGERQLGADQPSQPRTDIQAPDAKIEMTPA